MTTNTTDKESEKMTQQERHVREVFGENTRRVQVSLPASWHKTLEAKMYADSQDDVSTIVRLAILKFLRLGCPTPGGGHCEPLPVPKSACVNHPIIDY